MNENAIGVIGLGTMGCNLLLNISDHGYPVSGYDIDPNKAAALTAIRTDKVFATSDLQAFVSSLAAPAKIILLVPAGKIVDNVLQQLTPLLTAGDIIVDGGNSYFKDTERRFQELKKLDLHFMGVGISGGEEGARKGPSIMPGGDPEAYNSISTILNAIAAKYNNISCAAYMGNGPAGHYVKMVHNGIEYAIMQLIAESYHLLKRINHLDNPEIAKIFEGWSNNDLNGYLMESTSEVLHRMDDITQIGWLVDKVLDVARAKGTGKWASQDAMDLQVPVPVIDQAVIARDLSSWIDIRIVLSKHINEHHEEAILEIDLIQQALFAAFMLAYIQGLHLIHEASKQYGFQTQMIEVVRNWRSGCIIRSTMLPIFEKAYSRNPEQSNLLLDPEIFEMINSRISALTYVVISGIRGGEAIPCFQSSLSYFQMFTSAQLPMNIIQALRDHFGAHTFERRDTPGIFHADWAEKGTTTAIPEKK